MGNANACATGKIEGVVMSIEEMVAAFYKNKIDLDIASDKLFEPWVGNVWLDLSGYRKVTSYCDRALEEYQNTPTCEQVLLLAPSSTQNKWFYELSRYPVVFRRETPQALIYLGTRYLPFYKTFVGDIFYRCS